MQRLCLSPKQQTTFVCEKVAKKCGYTLQKHQQHPLTFITPQHKQTDITYTNIQTNRMTSSTENAYLTLSDALSPSQASKRCRCWHCYNNQHHTTISPTSPRASANNNKCVSSRMLFNLRADPFGVLDRLCDDKGSVVLGQRCYVWLPLMTLAVGMTRGS